MAKRNRKSSKPQGEQAKRSNPGTKPSAPKSKSPWIIVASVIVIAAIAFTLSRKPGDSPASPPSSSSPQTTSRSTSTNHHQFVGAEACASCHQEEYDLWKNSTHAKAGGHPGEIEIIARFDGKPLQFRDGIVTPTTNSAGGYLFVVEQNGQPKTEVHVKAVIGGGHMYGGGTQSFFQEFADGTVRFLPFDFIRKEDLWFVQLRRDNSWVPITEQLSLASDLAHWPPHRILGSRTDYSNCQNCHGSQITTDYDLTAKKFRTHYTSLRINCESCHGPGQRHIELMALPNRDQLEDIGMDPLATLTKDQSLQVCFQCHATKDLLQDGTYLPGDDFEEFFSIKLPAMEDTFEVDGRIREFSYQSPHLYSACYLDGSMTCVDCHDPHGQGYRDVFGTPLVGRFDDRQCTGCHASKAVDIEAHTHHAATSEGSRCTSCHMPFLQHKGLGHNLEFARSDHAIPIPRPTFDHGLGVENACQKCHSDQSIAWQETKVREWYGEVKPHHPMVKNLLQAKEVTDPAAAARLLLVPDANHPMAQISGLSEYLYRFLINPAIPLDPEAVNRLKALAQSEDVDLKGMALMALQVRCESVPGIPEFLEQEKARLPNDNNAIRNRWAITASYIANAYAADGNFPAAIETYQKSLEIKGDNVVVMSQLALANLKAGNPPETIRWLRQAIAIQPYNSVLHFQLAQTLARSRQIPSAIEAVKEGLKYAPNDPRARALLTQLQGSL